MDDNAIDSTQVNELDDVVITGQINKQHVDKSVFEVKVIKRETMDNLAKKNRAYAQDRAESVEFDVVDREIAEEEDVKQRKGTD